MFKDRKEAGVLLAERLGQYQDAQDCLVLALPRGGVVPAYEIARRLHLPLDVIIVRKIGFPGQPEFGIGAVAETGAVYLNRETISAYGIQEDYINEEVSKQQDEIKRRLILYRSGGKISAITDRTIILVDDGVATGATIRAAIMALEAERIKKLVIALPVAPPDTTAELEKMSDEFVCLLTPENFRAVGRHYHDFTQVSDNEVVKLLHESKVTPATDEPVQIAVSSGMLEGFLVIPKGARGIVIFAHGSGSSRKSVRNNFVAGVLRQAGLGTLLFDLLTPDEDRFYQNRFDIDLLADRLRAMTMWLESNPRSTGLKLGYFGASTGAAAALKAAAIPEVDIKAIVSRGGRPDLAGDALERVAAPTLLIVGGHDYQVIELNQMAYDRIRVEKEIKIIPRATHLFEEPGTLEEVARVASDWFRKHLSD